VVLMLRVMCALLRLVLTRALIRSPAGLPWYRFLYLFSGQPWSAKRTRRCTAVPGGL